MNCAFIESDEFSAWAKTNLTDAGLVELQLELLCNPDLGDVMPGCGGLRKLRIPDQKRRKGKRGGARVIYLHIPQARIIFLMDIFGKDEQEDLFPSQKKTLRDVAERFKREIVRQAIKEKPG